MLILPPHLFLDKVVKGRRQIDSLGSVWAHWALLLLVLWLFLLPALLIIEVD